MLIGLGLLNCLNGFRNIELGEKVEDFARRSLLLIIAGTVLFGLLIDRAGLLISVTVTAVAANLAVRTFGKPIPLLVSLFVLLILTRGLFVLCMNQPVDYLLPH